MIKPPYYDYNLITIDKYYSFMSQGNSFAPKLHKLKQEVIVKWKDDLKKHLAERQKYENVKKCSIKHP